MKCNHYLGYIYTWDTLDIVVRIDTKMKYESWIRLLDKRRNGGYMFEYCPDCGAKINRLGILKDIKSQILPNKSQP